MVYELASLGLPFIAVVQADNQQLISKYIKENNLGTICGDWNNFNPAQLKKEVDLLIENYQRRENEHNKLIKTVNKNGAELVAKGILEEYEKYCNSNA
jgi:spore coat polysaccharide biosynthesis predicted glycosyltransferase SpsG